MKLILTTKDKISQFNVLFQNLKAFSEHVNLHIDKEGIYMQGMDSSQCSCFESKLTSEWFDEYNYNLEKDTIAIGINTNILQKILGIYVETQTLELSVDDNEEFLNVSFIDGNNVLNKYFEIPLMDIESQLLDLVSDESNVDLTFESKHYCDLIHQLTIFNDTLQIEFTETKVLFLANGSDGTMKVNVEMDDLVEYAIDENFELKQSYNIRHISLMCLFSKLNKHCIMKYSSDRPMEAKYVLDNNSYVMFYLAAKIDD
tara:strand:+ start:21188 stop:21961 length:774 start_codon:yes stop_codon:yes gene_type:complete